MKKLLSIVAFTFLFVFGAQGQTMTDAEINATLAANNPTVAQLQQQAEQILDSLNSAEPAPEKYFVMMGGGWGPATGTRGELSVGAKVVGDVYGLLDINLAGGLGAVTGDVLYRAATNRGVTLWARGGAGATTTNNAEETQTKPAFGGGIMLTYDLSKVSKKLAGLEAYGTAKIMYVTDSTATASSNVVKPQYVFGLKFNWAGR